MLEGTWRPTRLVVLEFPTVEAARRWYTSAEYTKVKPIRHQYSVGRMVLVKGV